MLEVMACCHLSALVQRNCAVHTRTHTHARALQLLCWLSCLDLNSWPRVEKETLLLCCKHLVLHLCGSLPVPCDPSSTCSASTVSSVVVCLQAFTNNYRLVAPLPLIFHEPFMIFVPTGTELYLMIITNVAASLCLFRLQPSSCRLGGLLASSR